MQIIVSHVNSVVVPKKSEEKNIEEKKSMTHLEVIKPEGKKSIIMEEPENPIKLINYHSIIDNLIKGVKKTYIISNDEWKLLEENKNFLIHMRTENNKDLLFRAEAEIIAPKEKVL